ncbi:hypothetical protein [Mesorhizobium sp. WSM3873]|uniref:hypothetical protein n=1 Tax=Mesorhizobium sp. WSM3873 TaxID=1854056 RepID=UPI0007FFBF4D|nr:hypothetical protein [Mesorhizobium sp. WSM3873]OBQ83545.1 hypothetical protein A9K71_23550 [Mesorhizobium sp. WSM3873]
MFDKLKGKQTVWQIETAPYVPRIGAACDELQPLLDRKLGPPMERLGEESTPKQAIALQAMLFGRNAVVVVDQLLDNTGLLWSQGRMVGVSGLIRFALEYWAALHYAKRTLLDLTKDGDIEKAAERCSRLLTGSRTPIALYWGGTTVLPSVNVLTMIDKLNEAHSGARGVYEYLCEASHPSFVQNLHFIIASRTYDKHQFEEIKKVSVDVLERTVSAVEFIAKGFAGDGADIFRIGSEMLTNGHEEPIYPT